MSSYMLALLLLGSSAHLESGSLLVWEGPSKPIRTYTNSGITHVAIVLHAGNLPLVYEATPSRVRCRPLQNYLEDIGELNSTQRKPIRVWLMQPKKPYSRSQLVRMKTYLDSQLGRRYSVKGYVRKRQATGIHCAEFAASALNLSGRYKFQQRYALSPGELVQQVKPLHERPVRVSIPAQEPDVSWCVQTWRRWLSFQSWCTWASYEAWRFYW